jgi:hypothetical protein
MAKKGTIKKMLREPLRKPYEPLQAELRGKLQEAR